MVSAWTLSVSSTLLTCLLTSKYSYALSPRPIEMMGNEFPIDVTFVGPQIKNITNMGIGYLESHIHSSSYDIKLAKKVNCL